MQPSPIGDTLNALPPRRRFFSCVTSGMAVSCPDLTFPEWPADLVIEKAR